ncbi:hypothetical protein GCM10010279_05260 [Streptomyces mutabilis]|nr:hypothetical protein GCM10010279_05260 [Streptomyces mutabilis]
MRIRVRTVCGRPSKVLTAPSRTPRRRRSAAPPGTSAFTTSAASAALRGSVQGVPQGGVADGTGERGERGQHRRGQQDGEQGRGEQQAVRPRAQQHEPRKPPEPRH